MTSGSITSTKGAATNATTAVYVAFVMVALLIYHWIAEGEFSAVLTVSAIFQSLAFCLLAVHSIATDSVQGISANGLKLEAFALACRLSSTTWLEGYLPADTTGDYLYQAFDALSLAMVLWLLYRAFTLQSAKNEDAGDSLAATPLGLGAFVLACLLHGDLNDRPIFDALWMCGLFAGTIAVMPQLWLMAQKQRSAPAMTSHYVAVMALSRVMSGTYMWHAHTEISCEPWIKGFNHSGYAILAAHAVHLFLLADFAYFYVKNLANRGLTAPLELPESFLV